ncbi:styrene monooxygenase/indole monooxygenase family protein [Kitasatospora viridis]|uniref:2-polyprenyl-6-methoxyphenol hydroxylase-like FAD-dependent oxidoreductase n=1 Tax=Kitasatospora viridis TaxID=281105 RepID=A0A561T7G8_9ACTN|nr:styrene monooxygenase/indole monooxygenase family protein [Kitasatospora viridis]TWF83055.1 2-polyprenyl-6-methoxyphenol hydroxylase-like FAD-dependent oxidoreductase [Kitasatospora viridis]
MRRIAIAGAGQAGLQLGLGLLAAGFEVTVVAARTPGEVRGGPVLSSQAMFGPALRIEAAAGLDLWSGEVPRVGAVRSVLAAPPAVRALEFTMVPDEPAESVDQRLKMARWLELLEERGGRVEYRTLDRAGLTKLALRHELTVVATGRGEPASFFERDASRSRHDRPLRTISCLYVHGVGSPEPATEPMARLHALPGLGELYLQPALTRSGPCSILLWEAVPGGPLDCFADRPGPREQAKRIREVLAEFVPWEAELWAGAEPTDKGAGLYGSVTPTVRRPVAELAPELPVLGIGDTVVLNDPITGQGANSAARAAEHYLRAIVEHGSAPFTAEWMQDTFEAFWEQHARHAVDFTSAMLTVPDHLQAVFAAAAAHPEVARRFANTYADPADYAHWLATPELTSAYLGGF